MEVSVHKQTDKEDVVCLHNGLLHSHKKGWALAMGHVFQRWLWLLGGGIIIKGQAWRLASSHFQWAGGIWCWLGSVVAVGWEKQVESSLPRRQGPWSSLMDGTWSLRTRGVKIDSQVSSLTNCMPSGTQTTWDPAAGWGGSLTDPLLAMPCLRLIQSGHLRGDVKLAIGQMSLDFLGGRAGWRCHLGVIGV